MVNFRDYVSFELPVIEDETASLKGDRRALVEKAFEEIAETPEGAELLQRVAAGSASGKISVLNNEGGDTSARSLSVAGGEEKLVLFGTEDSTLRYYSSDTNQFHDFSIQRVLFHELQHLGLGHDDGQGVTALKEGEAIRATNQFMGKYYGEPMRSEDSRLGDFNGTKEWDFSAKAKPQGGLEGWSANKLTDSFGEKAKPPIELPRPKLEFQVSPQELGM